MRKEPILYSNLKQETTLVSITPGTNKGTTCLSSSFLNLEQNLLAWNKCVLVGVMALFDFYAFDFLHNIFLLE